MSIITEITRLRDAKERIKSAITAKGVNVPDTEKLDVYPDYILQIEGGGGGGGGIEPPYHVPGWLEHQDGNWVLVKSGQVWEIQYSDDGSTWTDASFTAGDVDTWFNMNNELFRQAKYIKRKNTTNDNQILAMNLDMPNYLSHNNDNTSSRFCIWQDRNIVNVKIKIDYFETYLSYCFYDNVQMTTCEIEQYRPGLMSATNMTRMFSGCSSLQSIGLSGWDVSNVTNMTAMFYGCTSLQSIDLSGWNFSKVTNTSMMFYGCSSLQSLDLSDWNVANVTNTSSMFYGCLTIQSLDLSGWDVSKVTNASGIFSGCTSLKDLKIKSKPKTTALQFYSTNSVLTNDSLQWLADNFSDISGDATYTNTTISGFSNIVKARYMWNYFYDTMTAKGYTIS